MDLELACISTTLPPRDYYIRLLFIPCTHSAGRTIVCMESVMSAAGNQNQESDIFSFFQTAAMARAHRIVYDYASGTFFCSLCAFLRLLFSLWIYISPHPLDPERTRTIIGNKIRFLKADRCLTTVCTVLSKVVYGRPRSP